jgi:hypothetical protein
MNSVAPPGEYGPVSFEGLKPVPDVGAADWIAPRLRGFGGRVHCVVPDGFVAYARILHPAYDEDGEPVPWAEVCHRSRRVAHRLMQWNSIAGVVRHTTTDAVHALTGETSEWPGTAPQVGELPAGTLAAVLEVLGRFTAEDDCYAALWEGWGWLHAGSWGFLSSSDDGTPGPEPFAPAELSAEVMAGPRLRLPGRGYVVFRGTLRAALRMGHQVTQDWFSPQSPSLLWPRDGSSCLATEIDFDSTLVGGSRELVDELLRAPGLEVWPVDPADDLTIDGDTVNR